MRFQLAFLFAVVQVALVGLARAAANKDLFEVVDFNSESTYTEKNYWSLNETEKIAFIYKPSLKVENGCDAYPAVFGVKNGKTQISRGLFGRLDSRNCRNRKKETGQIYARHKYTENKQLVILYAMYFPKQGIAKKKIIRHYGGYPHHWQAFLVIFKDPKLAKNPSQPEPQSIAWSIDVPKNSSNFHKLPWENLKPVEKATDTQVKLKMYYNGQESRFAHLGLTGHEGDWIPLIQYAQLENEVQEYLKIETWNHNGAPLSDDGFNTIVDGVVKMP